MQTRKLETIITDQPFFADIKPEFLALLVGCASHIHFKKGHFVLTRGKNADQFYIVEHGKISLEMDAGENGPVTLQHLESGEILGWSWLIPPYQWQFDALAIEPTSVIAFDGTCLRTKCDEDSELGYDLIKRMAGVMAYRLYHTRMKLMDFYT